MFNAEQSGRRTSPEAWAYRDELESLPTETLRERYRAVRVEIETRAKEEAWKRQERALCEMATRWSRKPYWDAKEAALLSVGLDPDLDEPIPSTCEGDLSDMEDSISRAQRIQELPRQIPPAKFIAWCDRMGISVPAALSSAIRERVAARSPAVESSPSAESVRARTAAPSSEQHEEDNAGEVSLLERRQQAIRICIALKGWKTDDIPKGGKSEIKKACLSQRGFFTESTFDKAWQGAEDVKTHDHEIYAKRG